MNGNRGADRAGDQIPPPDGLNAACQASRKAGWHAIERKILEIAARHRIEREDPAFGIIEAILKDLEIRGEFKAYVHSCRTAATLSAVEAFAEAKKLLSTDLVGHVAAASKQLRRLGSEIGVEISGAARRMGREGAAVFEAEIGRHVAATQHTILWSALAIGVLVIVTEVSGVAYGQWIGTGETGRQIAAAQAAQKQLSSMGWIVYVGRRQELFLPTTSGDAHKCRALRPGDGAKVAGTCVAIVAQ